MKKTVFLTTLIFLLTTTVYGFDISYQRIQSIQAYKAHKGMLYRTTHMVHNGCGSNVWYILPKHHPFYEENKEMLRDARILNHPVRIVLEGCFEGYPVIRDVEF